MTSEHPIIERARTILRETKEIEDKDSMLSRLEAVYQALSEETGIRKPVDGDTHEYFSEFRRKTSKKTELTNQLIISFFNEDLECGVSNSKAGE